MCDVPSEAIIKQTCKKGKSLGRASCTTKRKLMTEENVNEQERKK